MAVRLEGWRAGPLQASAALHGTRLPCQAMSDQIPSHRFVQLAELGRGPGIILDKGPLHWFAKVFLKNMGGWTVCEEGRRGSGRVSGEFYCAAVLRCMLKTTN